MNDDFRFEDLPHDVVNIIMPHIASLEDAIRLGYPFDHILQFSTYNSRVAFVYSARHGNMDVLKKSLPQSNRTMIFALTEALLNHQLLSLKYLLNLNIDLTFEQFSDIYFQSIFDIDVSDMLVEEYALDLDQNELNIMLEDSIGIGHQRSIDLWEGLGAYF